MAVGHSAEAAAAGRMLAASECLTVPDNPDSLTRPGLKLTGSSNKQLFETMPAAALCFGMVQSVGIPHLAQVHVTSHFTGHMTLFSTSSD